LNKADRQYLKDLASVLDTADRIGEKEDKPEGARHIEISDKLAGLITKSLLDIVARDIEDERKAGEED